MEIEYQNTLQDYKKHFKLNLIISFKRQSLFVLFVSIAPAYSLAGQPFDWSIFFMVLTVCVLFVCYIYFIKPYNASLSLLKKTIEKVDGSWEKMKIVIDDDGIQLKSVSRTTQWRWESIVKYNLNSCYISIILADKRYILIPKYVFETENDIAYFLKGIQDGIIKNGGIQKPQPKETTPPYLLGLFCLLPFIGIFIGIVLVLYGIFKYKDKFLVVVGLIGLVISVSVYFSAIKQVFNKDNTGFQFEHLSQNELNSLVKDVEFYKIQNGNYPDKLEEIKKDNSTININDPILLNSNKCRNKEYNYKRVGDKYYLFSSGVDCIANTADDIYPSISVVTGSKFGFLKK